MDETLFIFVNNICVCFFHVFSCRCCLGECVFTFADEVYFFTSRGSCAFLPCFGWLLDVGKQLVVALLAEEVDPWYVEGVYQLLDIGICWISHGFLSVCVNHLNDACFVAALVAMGARHQW